MTRGDSTTKGPRAIRSTRANCTFRCVAWLAQHADCNAGPGVGKNREAGALDQLLHRHEPARPTGIEQRAHGLPIEVHAIRERSAPARGEKTMGSAGASARLVGRLLGDRRARIEAHDLGWVVDLKDEIPEEGGAGARRRAGRSTAGALGGEHLERRPLLDRAPDGERPDLHARVVPSCAPVGMETELRCRRRDERQWSPPRIEEQVNRILAVDQGRER